MTLSPAQMADALRDEAKHESRSVNENAVLVHHESDSALVADLVAQLHAERAEVEHERLRYDGMRSDRDDWRNRCEEQSRLRDAAEARATQLEAERDEAQAEHTRVVMLLAIEKLQREKAESALAAGQREREALRQELAAIRDERRVDGVFICPDWMRRNIDTVLAATKDGAR